MRVLLLSLIVASAVPCLGQEAAPPPDPWFSTFSIIAFDPATNELLLQVNLQYQGCAKTVGTGILLLSVYSLGLGVPFLIASLGMNTFLSASKGIRKQLHTIEVVSGVILIVFGLALVTNVFGYFVAFLSRFLPAVG